MNDAVCETRSYLAERLRDGTDYQIRAGNMSGIISADFCSQSETAKFLAVINQAMTEGRLIKDDKAARIVRTIWHGRDIVIKRYNSRSPFRIIGNFIKGSRAKRTWFFSHLLTSIGLATAKPFAYLEERRFGLTIRSYIIMEHVKGPCLHHMLRQTDSVNNQSREALNAVRDMLDTMARHRLSHGDMKHSNIILTSKGPVIIDLDAMKIYRMPMLAARAAGKDIRRFLQGINTQDISEDIRHLCRQIFEFEGPLPHGLSTDYMSARRDSWHFLVRRRFSLDDAQYIVNGDAVCSDIRRFNRIFSSDFTRVYTSTCTYKDNQLQIHIKHYLTRSWFDIIKNCFRKGPGRRAFEAAVMLRRNGFDSPEPLAFIERHIGPLRMDNILVTQSVLNTTQLGTVLASLAKIKSPAALKQKRQIIRQFAAVVGQMHKMGIFHGDLRLGNVLVAGNDEERKFCFVDNERTQKYRILPTRLRVKNLVQVNMYRNGITNTDRMRFWAVYKQEAGIDTPTARKWLTKVLCQTRRRLDIRFIHHPEASQPLINQ